MKRRIIWAVLVLVLFFAVVFMGIQRSETQDTTVLYVDPSTTQVEVNEMFSINVSVANVTNLKGFEFWLDYNTTILNATLVSPTPISDDATVWGPWDEFGVFHWDAPPTINDTIGRVWVACWDFTPFTGSGAVLTIYFTATATGNSALHFSFTRLLDHYAETIDHTTLDGSVSISSPVGGIYIPVNKLSLLAPYIGLTILFAVAIVTVVYVKKRKRNTENKC